MPDHLTAERIIELLGLKPHPTCGFVTETYRAQQRIPDEALPTVYAGSRPFASVLYFMVTADARIRPHRIRSDQMYHYYIGEPLEVLLLYPDGTGEIKVLGADLNGQGQCGYSLLLACHNGMAGIRTPRSRISRAVDADCSLPRPSS
jgi:predicted cupin superfamily sugar epimerase